MNPFAKTLDSIITNKGISNNKAAKLCHMDTSLLRRYRNGERIPRSDKLFIKMREYLDLSEAEYDQLCYSFHKAKATINGFYEQTDMLFSDRQKIIRSMEEHSPEALFTIMDVNTCPCQADSTHWEDLPMMTPIHKEEDMARCIAYVYNDARSHEHTLSSCTFCSYLKVHHKMNQYILPDGIDTEHLIILSNVPDSREIVTSFLEHAGLCQQEGHHEFFLCQNLDTVLREHNYILFSEHLFLRCAYLGDKISGILTRDPYIINYYKNLYEKFKKEAICHGDDIYDLFFNYLKK